jgi:integrase
MAGVLTDAAVKKLKAVERRREVPDGGARGLFLIIQTTGAKSWAMRFRRPDGSHAKLTLGPVDLLGTDTPAQPVVGAPLTLAAARALASEIHRQRAMDRDVVGDHAAAKLRRRAQTEENAAKSYRSQVRQFIQEHARPKTRRWQETARLLGLRYPKTGDAAPEIIKDGLIDRWGERPVGEISADDIHAVVREAVVRGVPGLARRCEGQTEPLGRILFAALSSFFSWCQRHRKVVFNPCDGVFRPDAAPARDRVLGNDEIVALWRACDEMGEPFGALLKLLLLTGARLGEVAGMRRYELSKDFATWGLSGERTKNGRPHVVPLPPLARHILASVKQIASSEGLMFTTTGRTPVSGWSKLKARLDATMNIPPWRLHDLRRTAATGMAEIGIAPHIVEAALNHVSGARAGVAGTYNRAAYAPEKRAALERWAAHVEGLISGNSNIVPFSGERDRGRG